MFTCCHEQETARARETDAISERSAETQQATGTTLDLPNNVKSCPPAAAAATAARQSEWQQQWWPLTSSYSQTDKFLQGVSIADQALYLLRSAPGCRPSVRLSVTRWHWVKTTQATITKSSSTDSPRTLAFGIKISSRNSKGFTPSEGVKWEWGRENSQFSANNSPYLRNGAR